MNVSQLGLSTHAYADPTIGTLSKDSTFALTQKQVATALKMRTISVKPRWNRWPRTIDWVVNARRGCLQGWPNMIRAWLDKWVQCPLKMTSTLTARYYCTFPATLLYYMQSGWAPRLIQRLKWLFSLSCHIHYGDEQTGWTIDGWKRVLMTNEWPFQLFSPTNTQFDGVYGSRLKP